MKSMGILSVVLGGLVSGGFAAAGWGQIQAPAGSKSGPGVQAPQDSREPEVLKTCKVPPTTRRRLVLQAFSLPRQPREYTVAEIPGVVAAGQQWKEIWE